MNPLFHITEKSTWELAQKVGVYSPVTFDKDGFIHLSTSEQWKGALERFYKGKRDLVLLQVDQKEIEDKLKWEDLLGEGQEFPHYFDVLPLSAVKNAISIPNDRG